jgi:HEAT repeat protein
MLDDDKGLWATFAPERPVAARMLELRRLGKEERKTEARVDLLCRVLRGDPNPILRHDAAFVLGAMSADEAIDSLATAARNDENFLVRHECLESLAFFAALPSAVDAISCGARDPHCDVRETALMAEAYQRARPSQVAASALSDPASPVHLRWAAAFQLLAEYAEGRAHDAARAFARCLREDSSPFVRHTAAFMLEEVSGTSAWDELARAALSDPSPLVRHEAIETLGFLVADANGKALLERLSCDDEPTVALTARVALDIVALRAAGTASQEARIQ